MQRHSLPVRRHTVLGTRHHTHRLVARPVFPLVHVLGRVVCSEAPVNLVGVMYLFHRNLTSPLLVRGSHYTHVYWLHAVYCQTLRAS